MKNLPHRDRPLQDEVGPARQAPFWREGYQAFRQLLPRGMIAQAGASLARFLEVLSPAHPAWEHVAPLSCLKPFRNPGVSPKEVGEIPFVIGALPAWSEDFRRLILHEALWEVAGEILQSDRIIYHYSNLTRKPARIGPNLSWHRDYPNQWICPVKGDDFFRLLIPLEAMTTQNGATEVVPGTHQLSDAASRKAKPHPWGEFQPDNRVALVADPGDVFAIHPKLLHGGGENRSQEDRNLVVIQFGRAGVQYLSKGSEPCSGMSREEISRAKAAAGG